MIKEKDLRQYQRPTRYANGSAITLEALCDAFMNRAMEYQIPLEISMDQVKSGGMLSSGVQDCLVLFNPQHKRDYIQYVVTIRRQGTMAFVSVDNYGVSKNAAKLMFGNNAGSDFKTAIFSKDGNESAHALGRAIGGALRSIGGSKAKVHEEELWYGAMGQIIQDIVC